MFPVTRFFSRQQGWCSHDREKFATRHSSILIFLLSNHWKHMNWTLSVVREYTVSWTRRCHYRGPCHHLAMTNVLIEKCAQTLKQKNYFNFMKYMKISFCCQKFEGHQNVCAEQIPNYVLWVRGLPSSHSTPVLYQSCCLWERLCPHRCQ